MAIEVKATDLDFTELHDRIDHYVDEGIIPFVNALVMKGTDVVDLHFHGAINDAGQPLDESAIFRMHSTTKIVTSMAAMMLWEEGRFALDDPLEKHLPEFADMRVLREGATSIEDADPAGSSIRVNQILSHTAGFSYGFIEPESVIDQAYNARGINPMAPASGMTLQSLCEQLGELPLVYEPGTQWRYSFATDVTARLVEVLSGQRFDAFLAERIFAPLDMVDTGFYVPADKLDRLTTMYLPNDPLDPMSPCPTPMDAAPDSANAHEPSFLSGGGGLLSTLTDFLTFSRMIISEGSWNGHQLLKPETLRLMRTNQCAPGVVVNFPMWHMPGTTFGLGFALKQTPAEGEPASATGEYHWGGMAGAHFWWSPDANLAGITMTQRMPGFWHPFSHDFKRLAYQIAGD